MAALAAALARSFLDWPHGWMAFANWWRLFFPCLNVVVNDVVLVECMLMLLLVIMIDPSMEERRRKMRMEDSVVTY